MVESSVKALDFLADMSVLLWVVLSGRMLVLQWARLSAVLDLMDCMIGMMV